MIDYEKLIETGADEIHKTYLYTCEKLKWEVNEKNKLPYSELSDDSKELDRASFRTAIYVLKKFDLINEEKLKELTEPEPRYKVGDSVWIIGSKGGLHKATIKTTEYGLYTLAGHADMIYTDKDIFPTKDALIQSQIAYWTKERISNSSICSNCGMQRYFNGECSDCGLTGDDYPVQQKCCSSKHVKVAVGGGGGGTPIYHIDVKDDCEHESNTLVYYLVDGEYIHPHGKSMRKRIPFNADKFNKCKKCGEYYK